MKTFFFLNTYIYLLDLFVPKPSSEFVFNDDRQIECQSVVLFKIFIQFRHECYITRVYFRNLIVFTKFSFFHRIFFESSSNCEE